MLQSLDLVPWATLAQPPDNDSEAVPRALRALSASETREAAKSAYDRVLFAVGNNHAGTYYPVALHIVPFLEELLSHPSLFVREATLDILIDLAGSFEPEPAFQSIVLQGKSRSLSATLRASIGQIRLAPEAPAGSVPGPREHALRRELAELATEVCGEG